MSNYKTEMKIQLDKRCTGMTIIYMMQVVSLKPIETKNMSIVSLIEPSSTFGKRMYKKV